MPDATKSYLNLCWLFISEIQWQSPGVNFTRDTSAMVHIKAKICILYASLGNWDAINVMISSIIIFQCVPYGSRTLDWHCEVQTLPQPSIIKITSKSTYLTFHSNLPGATELSHCSLVSPHGIQNYYTSRFTLSVWSHPNPAVLPVGTLHSHEWFWVKRRFFIYCYHNTFVFFS